MQFNQRLKVFKENSYDEFGNLVFSGKTLVRDIKVCTHQDLARRAYTKLSKTNTKDYQLRLMTSWNNLYQTIDLLKADESLIYEYEGKKYVMREIISIKYKSNNRIKYYYLTLDSYGSDTKRQEDL